MTTNEQIELVESAQLKLQQAFEDLTTAIKASGSTSFFWNIHILNPLEKIAFDAKNSFTIGIPELLEQLNSENV